MNGNKKTSPLIREMKEIQTNATKMFRDLCRREIRATKNRETGFRESSNASGAIGARVSSLPQMHRKPVWQFLMAGVPARHENRQTFSWPGSLSFPKLVVKSLFSFSPAAPVWRVT
ncbi:MAG: hypothetical protein WCS52_14400 [bacterium]